MADLDNTSTQVLDTIKKYLNTVEAKEHQLYNSAYEKVHQAIDYASGAYSLGVCSKKTLEKSLANWECRYMNEYRSQLDTIPIQLRVSSLFLATGLTFIKTPGYIPKLRRAARVGFIWAVLFTPELLNPFSKK
jgi:hypothetical protein